MKFFRRNQAEYETAVPHQPNIGPLSKHIALVFSRDEVRELCLDLAFSFDELPEKGLTEQCTYLVELLQRSGRLPELMSLLQEKRPRYNWQKPIVSTPQDLRNRDILLQSVQTHWIDGFLHQVLSQTIALELNLSYIPQAVARKTLYISGQIEDPLVDTPLSDVFEKHGRSLLILGEPGSGKTITMLQLAEALIAIAQDDSSQPVPVILNLSSWAQQKQPLQDWLVEELFLQYGMSRKLSRTWIAQNLLLYFLDGLDEVAAESRDACVQAINNFKAEYPAELVVCSRLADYEQLKEKLNVATAVRLHPLTDNQIQTYLSHPELELTAVRDALATDPNLNELAHSPLFLNIMTLAYRGFTREQLQSFGTLANRRKHLFDTYVEEMFRRRSLSRDFHYSPEQAANWLVNIANGMENHSLSIFYVERLQPSWLPTYTLRNQYARRVGWIAGQVGFWMTILAGEMLSRLNFGYSGLIIIFPLAIILGMFTGRSYYRDALKNSIKLTEDAKWINLTFIGAIKKIWFILIMAVFMLIVGILFRDPLFGLLMGFVTLLGFGFPVYVEDALKSNENDFPQIPNQGVYSSLTNSLRIGMFGGLFMGMIFGVQGLLIGGAFGRFFSWLVTGLTIGFLKYGGMATINHLVLRELLTRNEIIPFSLSDSRLVSMLDNLSSRILLRRVGGGWVFIHRTLLEYFAALHSDAQPPAGSRQDDPPETNLREV